MRVLRGPLCHQHILPGPFWFLGETDLIFSGTEDVYHLLAMPPTALLLTQLGPAPVATVLGMGAGLNHPDLSKGGAGVSIMKTLQRILLRILSIMRRSPGLSRRK